MDDRSVLINLPLATVDERKTWLLTIVFSSTQTMERAWLLTVWNKAAPISDIRSLHQILCLVLHHWLVMIEDLLGYLGLLAAKPLAAVLRLEELLRWRLFLIVQKIHYVVSIDRLARSLSLRTWNNEFILSDAWIVLICLRMWHASFHPLSLSSLNLVSVCSIEFAFSGFR